MSTMTPWGLSDHKEKITRGINFYATPRHGGYHVSASVNQKIPEFVRLENGASKVTKCINGEQVTYRDGWYEEDVDWCIVVVFLPLYFNEETYEKAKQTMKNWKWREYERVQGIVLKPGESFLKDLDVFYEANKNNMVTVSAETMKEDSTKIKVFAARGGRNKNGTIGDSMTYIIDKEDYDKCGKFSYVVDETKYQPIEE